MTQLLTAAQMRAIEHAAIGSDVATGLDLMERAGAGAVGAILAEWPELADGSHRAVVLCGPGNNGGDGFVVARLLRRRGWAVRVHLMGEADRLPPDARTNHDRWRDLGPVAPHPETIDAIRGHGPIDLMVDALFGTGLSRPLAFGSVEAICGAIAFPDADAPATRTGGAGTSFDGMDAVGAAGRPPMRRVAVDVPSGLCADSGRVLGMVLQADLTVTFERAKVGHRLADGPGSCGRVVVVPIGCDPYSREAAVPPGTVEAWVGEGLHGGSNLATAWRDLARDVVREVDRPTAMAKAAGHKFDHGHALVLAGGVGRGGAARLAARAALRVGAGLVTVAPPPAALIENAARLDAVMLRAVRDAGALGALLEDGRISALCLGPGLGTGAREADLLRAALRAGRAAVLDGDALTLLSADAEIFGALHPACVLTPHAGEFARLFPGIAARLDAPDEAGRGYSKVDAAREAAARAGCTLLFKGPDTVIAEPGGRAAIHAAAYGRAAPWLATAGSGDVLAGLVAGLMARGWAPFDAGCAAAWLHVECARAFGPGLIAEDLPEMLPRVLARLEGWTPPG